MPFLFGKGGGKPVQLKVKKIGGKVRRNHYVEENTNASNAERRMKKNNKCPSAWAKKKA